MFVPLFVPPIVPLNGTTASNVHAVMLSLKQRLQ